MSVQLYFGLPGAGKTTILAKIAHDAVRSMTYENVYSNVKLSMFGVTTIHNEDIGKYAFRNSLILIDEATLFADSRSYKEFSKERMTYFLEHRHFNVDVILFTQQWDGVDRKIRVITDRVFYVYKPFLLGAWFSRYYRVPYDIIIPDPKRDAQKLGEIIQGYCRPNIFIRLFSPWVFRAAFYKYFNSFEEPPGFKEVPSSRKPYYEVHGTEIIQTEKQLAKYNRRTQLRKSIEFFQALKNRLLHLIRRSSD